MSQRTKQVPSNWNVYEQGRTSSVGSLTSIDESGQQQDYHGSPSSPSAGRDNYGSYAQQDGEQSLRTRRSSVFNSLRQMGGVNNIDNFARSFQRAAGFRNIVPVRRGSVSWADESDEPDAAESALPNRSLLRQQFEAAQQQVPEMAVTDTPSLQVQPDPSETTSLLRIPSRNEEGSLSVRSRRRAESGAELGTSYGTISSRLTGAAQRRASILIQQHIEASMRARELEDDGEEYKDNYIERPVEIETREDGEVIERIVGESTVPMTIFNSINILIGIGILALPLAVRYAGWVFGMLFMILPAILTFYTAKLLAKCLDTNSGSTTYGDLAFLAFGDVGRVIVEMLFVVELFGSTVALLILFGDTMHSLIPGVDNLAWKTILAVALLPLNFVPFRALSITSVLGIIATMSLVIIVLADGFVKPQKPGSLRDMMPTYAFPEDWRTLPLSIGLFVAPWGGHSVFPAVYKDMRHPQKYAQALQSTYAFTYGLDLVMAVFGYLMFGDVVRDEITSNILTDSAYPKALSVIIVVLISVIPITKIPLNSRPIIDTMNKKFMIDLRQMDAKARKYSEKSFKHRVGRAIVAVGCNIITLLISILIPEFDSIMATMGSSVCITICAILPLLFSLKIFAEDKEISRLSRIKDWILIVICAIFALFGTVFALLPKEKIGARACQGIACMG